MDWFSFDPNRPGVFAVGQESQGVFALGQSALGVVAVGQLARGVIAVGQGAVGIVAVGQGAVGVAYCVAMLGVGARGWGGVVRLVPDRAKADVVAPPEETALDALRLAGEGDGWVKVTLVRGDGGPEVHSSDGKLELADRAALGAMIRRHLASHRSRPAYVRVAASRELEADAPGYRDAPPVRTELRVTALHGWQPPALLSRVTGNLGVAGVLLRAVGLAAVATVWWWAAGADVVAMFRG